jgi:long-chain fatty acid transport protein
MVPRRFRHFASSVLAGGTAFACLSFHAPARAAGFYVQEQSTRGAGRAFSGEAADTGPESLFWNPASIAESPAQVYGSASGIFPHCDVFDQGSTITFPSQPPTTVPISGGSHVSCPILEAPLGGLGFASPIGDRFAVGLSLASPFDLVTKYPENSFARYEAIKSRLDTADVQLTGAVKALPMLDLGVGVDAVYTSARLTNALPNLSPLLPDGFSNLTGDTWDVGWNVGAQVHTSDRWRFGLSYRSAVTRTLSGTAFVDGLLGPLAAGNTDTHAEASFTTPWIATFAGRFNATPQLTLNVQVQRFGWSEFHAITVTGPGVSTVIPENYQDTTSVAFGFDYAIVPHIITVRAGAQHDPTPTPDVGRELRVPDSDRWLISGGAELTAGKQLTVEGAIEYVDFQGSHIDSSATFFPGTAAQTVADYSGLVTANAVVVSGGVRWRF